MRRVIKIKGVPRQTCAGCPIVYEFDDLQENHYYFRMRHGYWKIVNESAREELASGEAGFLDLDGICTLEEAIMLCASEQVFLLMDYCDDESEENSNFSWNEY